MKTLHGIVPANKLIALCKDYHRGYQQRYGVPVRLAILWIGDHSSSELYIHRKRLACEEVGIYFYVQHFSGDSSPHTVKQWIKEQRDTYDGLLVQLPVPEGHLQEEYLSLVPMEKDVDGINPMYRGLMTPCTPLGCLLLLKYYGIPIGGKACIMVGCSALVGRPLGELLLEHHGTVLFAHEHTVSLEQWTRQGDILCVATGKKHLIRREHVSRDAVILDVGIHRTANGITGDVSPEVYSIVRAYSPVPGGVGPMTVACLVWNTLYSAFYQRGERLRLEDIMEAIGHHEDPFL